ncbi:AraC family transcriptional regulator [Flavobacterium plurextorum]|uniref:Helix-turn-helix domain-containing protein n=1 Tax=Flavobacterium quisquiliarum TaxID=1834436 RepID=A0ABV8VY28_9FLAO|nr:MULTISPECIES: AraC family transcriptional regulator [Flavobacterium]MBW1653971.1 helix-turn-helix domain-containing protein [Flavobacterium quisquiliarum]UUW07186.1 AraC family transcriptional regulator [Flavobacterium plurextorum]
MQKNNGSSDNTAEYHLNQYQHNVPRFSLYQIDAYLKKYDKKRRKAHAANHYQIIWFKKGNGSYFVNLKAWDIDQNTLFFLTENDNHYFDRNTNYSGVLIQFNEEFLIQDNKDTAFFSKHSLLDNRKWPFFSLTRDDAFILDEYLNLIRNEFADKNQNSHEELLRSYLKAFLIQLQYRWEKEYLFDGRRILPEGKKQLLLMKFLDLVEENYKKELKICHYAELMQISSRTLSGLTSQLLDKSPSEIICERIIAEAERMLLGTNYNISEIGNCLGFDDNSYFVKYFKKYTGISPLDFRRSSLKEIS